MRIRTIGLVAAALAIAAAPAVVEAQGQRQGRQDAQRGQRAMMASGAGQMGMRQAVGAEYFLARSAQLGLTDQQVLQLAAIARRAEARREAARASMPAMAGARMAPDGPMGRGMRMAPGGRMAPGAERAQPADSAARAQMREARVQAAEQARAAMAELRAQREADLRDAIAVLTPEQQAAAWRMRGRR